MRAASYLSPRMAPGPSAVILPRSPNTGRLPGGEVTLPALRARRRRPMWDTQLSRKAFAGHTTLLIAVVALFVTAPTVAQATPFTPYTFASAAFSVPPSTEVIVEPGCPGHVSVFAVP